MPQAKIGSGSETLALSSEVGTFQPDELLVELRAETLSASASIYALEFRDLAEFFEDLATDWLGWSGFRMWRSLEGDLEISAEHHRHVLLRIALRGDPYRSDWRVSATIELDPGEELSAAATDIRALVAGPLPGA
jgi:hypothetical protein